MTFLLAEEHLPEGLAEGLFKLEGQSWSRRARKDIEEEWILCNDPIRSDQAFLVPTFNKAVAYGHSELRETETNNFPIKCRRATQEEAALILFEAQ